jgi:hypothetical protein
MLDNLMLPHDGTSRLQPFINLNLRISRVATMATIKQLKDELLKRRDEVSCYGPINRATQSS